MQAIKPIYLLIDTDIGKPVYTEDLKPMDVQTAVNDYQPQIFKFEDGKVYSYKMVDGKMEIKWTPTVLGKVEKDAAGREFTSTD